MCTKKKPRLVSGVFFVFSDSVTQLDLRNVLRLETFGSGCDFELDGIAFVQSLVTVAGDLFEMDEYVFATRA